MALFSALLLSIVFAHIVTRSASYSCGTDKLDASTTSAYTLSSPGNNGLDSYPPDADCEWTITAPFGNLVELKFTIFDTYGNPTCGKSSDDVLKIYDGNYQSDYALIGKYCGSYLPAKVVSSKNSLTLVFKSSNRYSVTKKGFRLQYKAIDKPASDISVCSPPNPVRYNKGINLYTVSSTTKMFKSPWYPSKYPSNIECVWTIKTLDWDKKIKLKVKNVNIFNYETPRYCNKDTSDIDSLIIFDGSGTYSSTLKTYCKSSSSSTTLTSSGSELTIRFKSNYDNYFTGSTAGFEAEYSEIEDSSSSVVGTVIGSIIGVICLVGLIVCCVCIAKRRGTPGYVQRGPAMATVQATTTTTTNAPQYPMQPQGGYQPPPPPAGQVHYPPPGQINYPPPVQGSYPPPTQGSYPPPTQGSYPTPTQGSYPPPGQGGYPPTSQAGGYPQTAPYPVPSDPPPQYPGPPAYPPQANLHYNPQGGPQQPPYPPPVDSKASAPPPF